MGPVDRQALLKSKGIDGGYLVTVVDLPNGLLQPEDGSFERASHPQDIAGVRFSRVPLATREAPEGRHFYRRARHRLCGCPMRVPWAFLPALLLLVSALPMALAADVPAILPDQPISLDAAVAYGLDHNRFLQAAEEEVRASGEGIKQARAGFYPRLDGRYGFTYYQDAPYVKAGASQLQISSQEVNRWETQVSQPVFTGYALSAQYEYSRLQYDVSTLRRDEVRLDLTRDIQHAFLKTLLAEKLLQVRQEAIRQLQTQRRNAEVFYQQGLTPRNDVLKADVALADALQKEQAAAKDVRTLRSHLNQLLDLDPATQLCLAEWSQLPHEVAVARDVPALYQLAERQRPELLALQTAILQAEQGARLARSGLYPRASVVGSYYWEGKDFLARENDFANEHNGIIGVRVDWNWFEGGKTRAAVNEWAHRRQALEQQRRNFLRRLYVQVEDAAEQIEVSRRNWETARAALKQAAENERMTVAQYREQVAVFSEVLDARVYLSQAEVNHHQGLYGFQLAWADLERAIGGPLAPHVVTGSAAVGPPGKRGEP
jgi:outer membrane protein TolC